MWTHSIYSINAYASKHHLTLPQLQVTMNFIFFSWKYCIIGNVPSSCLKSLSNKIYFVQQFISIHLNLEWRVWNNVQRHFWKEHLCVLQVFLCELVSLPVCDRLTALVHCSASDWCALQEALYKCIDTIQYNTCGAVCGRTHAHSLEGTLIIGLLFVMVFSRG